MPYLDETRENAMYVAIVLLKKLSVPAGSTNALYVNILSRCLRATYIKIYSFYHWLAEELIEGKNQ